MGDKTVTTKKAQN